MIRGLVLALFVAFADAGVAPTVSLKVNHDKILGGPSTDKVSGDLSVESTVTDNIAVGANLGVNASPTLRSLVARISERIAGRDVKANLKLDLEASNKPITGTIDLGSAGNTYITAAVNTGNPGYHFVDSVTLTTEGSQGWKVAPTIHLDDSCKIDLVASAKLSSDVSAQFNVDKQGKGHASVDYTLDSDTTLGVAASDGLGDMTWSLSRRLGSSDSIKVTGARAKPKNVDVTYTRQMGTKALTASVSQFEKVDLQLTGGGDWSATASMPLTNPGACDLSLGKKLSLSNLKDMGLGPIKFGSTAPAPAAPAAAAPAE